MRRHAYLLAAAHFALSVSLSVPRPGLMPPRKKAPKNPGGFAGELGLFGDGATDRAKHLRDLVGKRVRVFWPKEDRYFAGVVTAYQEKREKGKVFYHTIHYDDDETETINLAKQTWHEIDDDASDSEPVAKKPKGLHEERIEALKKKGPDPW